MNNKSSLTVRKMTAIAMFSALIAILSQISIPMPTGVPLTLQTFAVCLCGYAIGSAGGTLSVAVYLALGAVGAPVFSGFSGGIQRFLGYTGGFLFGFLIISALCGSCRKRHAAIALLTGILGVLGCLLFGAGWYAVVAGRDMLESIITMVGTYFIKDALSCVAAYFISRALNRAKIFSTL